MPFLSARFLLSCCLSLPLLSACGELAGGREQPALAGDAVAAEYIGHDESSGSVSGDTAARSAASLTAGEWLAGDLHLHSEHSLDSSANPVAKIIATAQAAGLHFLGITDHDNHVDGDVAHHTWLDPSFLSSPLIMLYGAEWTTHRGHGNTFSDRPYDHQTLYDLRDAKDVLIGEHVAQEGIHLSANHPTGADHFGFSYDLVRSVEVWQTAIWNSGSNASALTVWDDMMKSGRKLTARGGSDSHHGLPTAGEQPSQNSFQALGNYVGTPTTWVFARERSATAVVEALNNGRVSISANPYSPRVELTADVDADGVADAMMGDNIAASGQPVTFRVEMVGAGAALLPYRVDVIRDGAALTSLTIAPGQSAVTFSDTPAPDQRHFYRVEVQGAPALYPEVPGSLAVGGLMVALSNPIFFNFPVAQE